MAYEALYRRYRPRRFADVKAQQHVVASLENAVANDRVGHAYMFSGPRGTGKTSSARILAKALNCTNRTGGEPCDECDSCVNFNNGTSYDLRELDAASNNGVDAMRDLISKVGLSAGGHGVFILDEVHMLSSGAENALLKTLEEPPPGVTFILCTTEPNKVVPTIRSRTQHLEFNLFGATELTDHIREVVADAGIEITDQDIDFVVQAGAGSARDALSALDQVVAAGGAPENYDYITQIIEALAARDAGQALVAVNEATRIGRDPETIGRGILAELRNAFLAIMGADLSHVPEAARAAAVERSQQMGAATLTRSMELIGRAVVDMRQAPDPRVDLEVALVRIARPQLDTDVNALVARIEQLERHGGGGGGQAGVGGGDGGAVAPLAQAPPPLVAEAPATAPQPVEEAPPATPTAAAPPAPSATPTAPAPAPQAAPPGGGGGGRPADVARAALNRSLGNDTKPPPAQAAAQPTAAVTTDASEAPAPTGGLRDKPTLGSMRRSATTTPAAPAAAAAPPTAEPVAPAAPTAAVPAPVAPTAPAPPTPASTESPPSETAAAAPAEPPPTEQSQPAQVSPAVSPQASLPAAAPPTGTASTPSIDDMKAAWHEHILPSLAGTEKARFSAGEFQTGADGGLEFALPNDVHRQRCEDVRGAVDAAIAGHFGAPIPVTLVAGAPSTGSNEYAPVETMPADPAAEVREEEIIDMNDLTDATEMHASVTERLAEAFPGAELVEDDS